MFNAGLYLSIVATTLSAASFSQAVWRLWQDRPRLQFYVSGITFTDVPHFGEMKMIQVLICNVGYRSIILTRFAALGAKSSYQMGIHDEPSAAIGRQDQKFPVLLEAGKTLAIHPIGVEALHKNLGPQESPQHFHDPYKFFVVEDSFGRFYPMEVEEVAWHLRISGQFKKSRGLAKVRKAFSNRKFLREAPRRVVSF